jgi:TIR domain
VIVRRIMATGLGKPRVFISHVNGDPGGEEIWPALHDALSRDGYDVLVDREYLRAGDRWRTEVYNWIGLCHAAVVLISRDAIKAPNKYWVARETACLMCRRSLDPSLKIIPVLLDGITIQDLNAVERFRDLELSEQQYVTGNAVAPIVNGIVAGLAGFRPVTEPALARLATQIRAELAGFHVYQVDAVLADCDVELGGWCPPSDPHLRLALSLLAVDVAKLPGILGRLIEAEPGQRARIAKVADLLLANWVDIEAAQAIVEEGVKRADDGTRRPLVLNAPDERLAELYTLRAFPDMAPEWKLLRLTAVFGECNDTAAVQQQLCDEIEHEIECRIIVRPNAAPDPASKQMRRLEICRHLANSRLPVFVTAEINADDKSVDRVLQAVAERYLFATFLLRSRVFEAELGRTASSRLRPLTPALSAERVNGLRLLDDRLYDSLERGRGNG